MDRPRYIDLGSGDSRAINVASRMGLPSPRVQHYDGDVPPSLSPLDAFAAHSRRLAKELEETRIAGQRRMSRLPPQVVTQSLSQHQANRPAIFRSLSGESQDGEPPVPPIDHEFTSGHSPEVTDPFFRPTSAYTRVREAIHSRDHSQDENIRQREQLGTAQSIGVSTSLHQTSHPNDYFGAPESESPVQETVADVDRLSLDQKPKVPSQSDSLQGLAPPIAAFARSKLYHESSEDDYASSNAGSFFSQTRKLSSSSGASVPRSPALNVSGHERSPSNISTTSLSANKKVPAHLNFSRPRSSVSLHSRTSSPTKAHQNTLHRKPSHTSEYDPRSQTSFDDARSVMSDGYLASHASSYTHSKFTLPRGRADRTSALFSGLSTPHFEWSEPMFPSTPPLNAKQDNRLIEPIPQSLERLSQDALSENTESTKFSFEFHGEAQSSPAAIRRPSSSHTQSSQNNSVRSKVSLSVRPSTSHGTPTPESKKWPDLPPMPLPRAEPTVDGQSRSSRSNSTVRPTTSRSVSNYQDLSADDHVTKAIDLHQHGDLKQSTYHLRIAARQDHPTGMLLYALACRHGWGMRPNQTEGVSWLKKAVDTAMLEMVDDENTTTKTSQTNVVEKKAHRAQFALSIYELGISHLNGWGVELDKSLALRCFEIAGSWGDPDALTEAGFCYAEGIGAKKDLKKAAKFYRQAEKKGVSMVGNSWIHKPKYDDDDEDRETNGGRESRSSRRSTTNEKDRTPRSKSKSRSIFGRKKGAPAVPA